MVLKIYAASIIHTEFFLTMDSDTILAREVQSIDWFLPFGKARVVGEQRKWHDRWYAAAERLL